MPLVGWDEPQHAWEDARRTGLGASEVAALLGLDRWTTPWQVWAEKVDAQRPDDHGSPAAELGHALEPWLVEQATGLLGTWVTRTPDRLYAHPTDRWALASPDAHTGSALVECKSSGLYTPRPARGWAADQVPLSIEIQCHWQMHVTDYPLAYVVGLVAGLGLRVWEIPRDPAVEADLVDQVRQWWEQHVIGGVEPPLGSGDAAIIAARWPTPTVESMDLEDTDDGAQLVDAYLAARAAEAEAKAEKDGIGARLKALLGPARIGYLAGRPAVTWGMKRGRVDYERMAAVLAEKAGVEMPDPDDYRRDPSRAINVKEQT